MKIKHTFLIRILLLGWQTSYSALVEKSKISPEQQRWLNQKLVNQCYVANASGVLSALAQGANPQARYYLPMPDPGMGLTPLEAACQSQAAMFHFNAAPKKEEEKAVGVIKLLLPHLSQEAVGHDFVWHCYLNDSDAIKYLLKAGVTPPKQVIIKIEEAASRTYLLSPQQAIWKRYVNDEVGFMVAVNRDRARRYYNNSDFGLTRFLEKHQQARLKLIKFSNALQNQVIDQALEAFLMPPR